MYRNENYEIYGLPDFVTDYQIRHLGNPSGLPEIWPKIDPCLVDFIWNDTYTVFPKCKTQGLVWIAAVRRQQYLPTKFSRICSLHFSPSAFTMDLELAKQCGYQKMTLQPDAVPTVAPHRGSRLRQSR